MEYFIVVGLFVWASLSTIVAIFSWKAYQKLDLELKRYKTHYNNITRSKVSQSVNRVLYSYNGLMSDKHLADKITDIAFKHMQVEVRLKDY